MEYDGMIVEVVTSGNNGATSGTGSGAGAGAAFFLVFFAFFLPPITTAPARAITNAANRNHTQLFM